MALRIIKYLLYGISWGCSFFVLTCLVGNLVGGDAFLKNITDDFVRQALGAMAVGIFCGTTAIVYTFRRLALWKCIAIHFSVGLTGYFLTACYLNWMPKENLLALVGFLAVGVISFAGIWACFYYYNRREAKKLNTRLKELEKE